MQGAGQTIHLPVRSFTGSFLSEMAGVFASEDSHVLSVRTWVFHPSLSDHLLVTEYNCREEGLDPGMLAEMCLVAGRGEAREVLCSWFSPK